MWVITAATLKNYKNHSNSVGNKSRLILKEYSPTKKIIPPPLFLYRACKVVHFLQWLLEHFQITLARLFFFSNQRVFQYFKFSYNFSDRFCSKFPKDNILFFFWNFFQNLIFCNANFLLKITLWIAYVLLKFPNCCSKIRS